MKPYIFLQTARGEGAIPPLVGPPLERPPLGWQLQYTKGADWPQGGAVVEVLLEKALDAEGDWLHEFSATLAGGDWPTSKMDRTPALSSTCTVWSSHELPYHIARLSVRFLQPCAFGVKVWVL
jgi:hypothetical protein